MKTTIARKSVRRSSIVIIAVLLLSGTQCTHQKTKVETRYKNGNPFAVITFPDIKDTSTYEMTNYYPNGKLYKVAHIENGNYVGKKVTYFQTGKVMQIDSLFKPCARHSHNWDGILLRFNENGTISQRYTVKNGLFNGLFRQFSDSGVLIKQYFIVEDSIKNGLYEEFYKNGQVSVRLNYSNNLIEGLAYFFNENGDTVKYYNFRHNLMTFPYKRWLGDGRTITGVVEDSTRKIVVWKWNDRNGTELKRKRKLDSLIKSTISLNSFNTSYN